MSSGFPFAHGFSFQVNDVGVVNESVKNGVGQGGIADSFMPVFNRYLGRNQRRSTVVTVFHDLEEVSSFFVRQEGCSPVVDD